MMSLPNLKALSFRSFGGREAHSSIKLLPKEFKVLDFRGRDEDSSTSGLGAWEVLETLLF